LHAGRKPRPDSTAATVKDAANHFLNAKKAAVDHGELSPLTWADYKEAAGELVAALGKGRLLSDLGPDDFAALRSKMAKRRGRASAACSNTPLTRGSSTARYGAATSARRARRCCACTGRGKARSCSPPTRCAA